MTSSKQNSFTAKFLVAAALCLAVLWMTACSSRQSDEQLQQQAAHATAEAKKNAKVAADDARVAAANAERKIDDVARGVKEGMNGGKSSPDVINVNSASRDQLMALPGITDVRAQRIMDRRPYDAPHDMVRKGAISEAEYGRISGQVAAN
jgi:DNA uptake protein ComE-like DNA-binding protein